MPDKIKQHLDELEQLIKLKNRVDISAILMLISAIIVCITLIYCTHKVVDCLNNFEVTYLDAGNGILISDIINSEISEVNTNAKKDNN